MTVTTITCIRHGRSAWNAQGRWQGHANVGLDEVGLVQAARIAAWMSAHTPLVTAIYSSDLLRARQTADSIAVALGLSAQIDPRLREIDMGEWQGMTREEVESYDGARLNALRAGGYAIQRPSGESLQQVADRAFAFFREVIGLPDQGSHLVLVSHGGTIRMLLYALGLLETTHVTIENTSRTTLLRAGEHDAWRVGAFAEVDHLTGLVDTDDQPM